MPFERTHAPLALDDEQRADLVRRAMVAWIKDGGTPMPGKRSGVTEDAGLVYVVLRGPKRVLGVYRAQPRRVASTGSGTPAQVQLRRLTRWPESLGE